MPAGKDKDSGLSPEITRLSALLARDPNSKLFMPLAEEYIKAGMAEEAIMTLEEGLKANPYYMSARVLLGKAYMEKADLDAARGQFEQVTKTVPDNILAHRKLGEIYRTQGRREDAVRSYKMITLLSPKDEDAKRCLSELESDAYTAPAAPSGTEEPQAPAQAPVEADVAPVFDLSGFDEAEPEGEAEVSAEIAPDEKDSVPTPAFLEVQEAEPADEDALSLVEASEGGKNGYALDLSKAEGLEDIFGTYGPASHEEEPGEPEEVYEIEEGPSFEINAAAVPEITWESEPEDAVMLEAGPEEIPGAKVEKDPFETETLAELYIAQGFYDRAVSIYKNLLLLDPQNFQLKQKLEELYQLESLNASKPAVVTEPEFKEPEPEPLPSFEEDDGAGIVWEAEAEAVPEPFAFEEAGAVGQGGRQDMAGHAGGPGVYDAAAVSRLERFLDNIMRKGRR